MFAHLLGVGSAMPDDKDIRWAAGPEEDADHDETVSAADRDDGRDGEPWDAYRKWLSRRGDRPRSRGALDPSLYTWKGYRNWAEEVKRNWSDRNRSDRDES
jgi:hypothetical protein